MKAEFFLPLKPMSVNRMYNRDRRHKSQAYKDWEISAFNCLQHPKVAIELQELRLAFNPDEHVFSVQFIFNFPELFNKAGSISSRVEDLSNIEKPLLDVLFLPKVHVQPFPHGALNINCDDKYVIELNSKKIFANRVGVQVIINMLPKSAAISPEAGP